MGGLTYIKSFDGMRGAFAIVVILAHWSLALPFTPFGWEFLQLFFVISGYLITRILLYEKSKAESFGGYAKSFYIKRTFRIFPLYYFYFLIAVVLMYLFKNSEFMQPNIEEFTKNWKYYLTYTSNLKFFINFKLGLPYNDSPFFAHLWSLALEEQFYLVMPFFIYFLSRERLKYLIIFFVLLPIFTRYFGYHYLMGQNDDPVWTILLIYRNIIFQTDGFALGAALAAFSFDWIKHPKRWMYLIITALIVSNILAYPDVKANFNIIVDHLPGNFDEVKINVLSYLALLGHPEVLVFNHQYAYSMTLVNFMCFFLVLGAIRDDVAWKGLLHNKWMIEVGKVSYGVYVFHFMIIIFFVTFAGKIFGGVNKINILLHIPLFVIYLIILYYLSLFVFTYVEMPFLKMREKFLPKKKKP